MLTAEENDLLTETGPETPMGQYFRRFWQPAILSEELPECDGSPIRVTMMDEELVAFRDSNGAVGLVDTKCPHRGADLYFGRNEQCGLRCVYHGWKFNVNGKAVDLPNVPPRDGAYQILSDTRIGRHRLGLYGPRLGYVTGITGT
jgi:phthalate 4,5-dioxygenase oxygenase subunit